MRSSLSLHFKHLFIYFSLCFSYQLSHILLLDKCCVLLLLVCVVSISAFTFRDEIPTPQTKFPVPVPLRTERQSSVNYETTDGSWQDFGLQQRQQQFSPQVPNVDETRQGPVAPPNPLLVELAKGNTKFSLNMFKVKIWRNVGNISLKLLYSSFTESHWSYSPNWFHVLTVYGIFTSCNPSWRCYKSKWNSERVIECFGNSQ